MRKTFKEVDFLFPQKFKIRNFIKLPATEPFSEEAVGLLDALAKILLYDRSAKIYPDIVTFAFFCRKGNILKLKEKYTTNDNLRLGRGIVFHISPSNVPINFAYSLLCGILAGNTNIIRVPSKPFEQIDIIINALTKLKSDLINNSFLSRLVLLRYARQNIATDYFSSICDVRVIWGGDQTIEEIRKNQIPARSFDITFADRYSICIINADKYIFEKKPKKIAEAFYNDTYLFDQNACTSPQLIIWLGKKRNVKKSKIVFWDNLHAVVKDKYKIQPIISVDKLTTLFNQAICSHPIKKEASTDNLIWRVEIERLENDLDEHRCSCGYFLEYHASSLSELKQIINRKYQTLAYYGISNRNLQSFIRDEMLSGIDRIVPIGKTMDFSLTWDGYNLIETLSRNVEIV